MALDTTEVVEVDKQKQTILIVDDAAMNRALLADMLGDNYNIIEASNGVEAVAIMQSRLPEISLVLLDIVMPEMDGLEVLAVMNKRGWINDLPVVMVSAETASSVIERAYTLGVTDFISRPFDTAIVRRRVLNTLMLYAKQKALVAMVEDQIYEREKSVSLMVSILSQIVEFRNGESGLHVLHVNTMTELLLKRIVEKSDEYDFTPDEIAQIAMASSLHDIGKIAIPEEILNKPGKLTDEEFEMMKHHSAIGADMLKNLPNYEKEPLVHRAYEICRWHHERYDGKGYPDGLKGDEIPISAQVVALADVYDALTSERVYKPPFEHDEALRMINNGECGTFNPFLLECLNDIADEIHEQLKTTSISDFNRREVGKVAKAATKPEKLGPSNRTLDLLEYEREKFNFFAKMSNEIQFEFTPDPPIAILADWGVAKLGLPEIIHDPYDDPQLNAMFGKENLKEFHDMLRATTPSDPVVQIDCMATVKGEPRWFHLAARALWRETSEGLEYTGSVGKLVDIHESRQRLTELERKATHDSLTGLTNHDYARKVISEDMRENPDRTFVLMVLDLDHFKDFNDNHGHLFGDEILQHLSERLKDSVRDTDIVARVGGDEFMICMECDVDPKPLVDRVYNRIVGKYKDMPISISMGVVFASGKDGSYDELFRSADKALYDMKRNGRGGYVFGTIDEEGGTDSPSVISEINEAKD